MDKNKKLKKKAQKALKEKKSLKRKKKEKKAARKAKDLLKRNGKKLKKKVKVKYEKARCKYFYPPGHKRAGKRCKRDAKGASSCCKKHGSLELVNLTKDKTSIARITKYDPSIHPIRTLQLAKRGFSLVEIAAEFEIHVATLDGWGERYEDFYEVLEIAKTINEAWWINEGKTNLDNSRFQTPLYKFLAGNLLGYSDKIENNNRNTTLYGVLKVPGQLSNEDWEKAYDDEQEKVASMNSDIIDVEPQ